MSPNAFKLMLLLATTALLGCPPSQGIETWSEADTDVYANHVHAYVTVACGALNCHGNPGRPLRIYSELGLRIDPALRTTPTDEAHPATPITDEELQDNVIAFSTVSPLESGLQHFALQKPLAGGVDHVGGKLFADTNAPGYLCLRAWLVIDDPEMLDPETNCKAALASLGF